MHPIRPVIILGAARSGTKFLRDTLGASLHTRVVPYDVSFVWRRGNEDRDDDVLPSETSTPEVARTIRDALDRLAVPRKADAPAFLLEKTVGNTLRVPFVRAVFPQARFVHLLRDGRDVVESSWRMWHAPPDRAYLTAKLWHCFSFRDLPYFFRFGVNMVRGRLGRGRPEHVWGVRYPGIDEEMSSRSIAEICARQWAESVRRARADLADVPGESRIEVRFEDLVESPDALGRLCEWIGLPDAETVIERYRRTLSPPRPGAWATRFDASTRQQLAPILNPILQETGYPLEAV